VLAALTDDDPEWWAWQVKHTKRWEFHGRGVVTHGAMLAGARRDGGLFWRHEIDDGGLSMRPITPAEAWEMLAARDLIPLSWTDHRRRFGMRGGARCYHCPRGTRPPVCTLCDGTKLRCDGFGEYPATLEDLVAFASLDPERVERAERLGAESIHHDKPTLWRFGAVSPENHGSASRVQAVGAIHGLGFGEGQAERGSIQHSYRVLVCPAL
jgi:hypothetical protein